MNDKRFIEEFIVELDARIDGKDGGSPQYRRRLAAMRPLLVARLRSDPERWAAVLRDEIEATLHLTGRVGRG